MDNEYRVCSTSVGSMYICTLAQYMVAFDVVAKVTDAGKSRLVSVVEH